MSSFLFLQQCPTCLVCFILIVFEKGGRWPYSCSFVECCFQDLFSMIRCNLEQFYSIFFSIRFSLYNFSQAFSLYAYSESTWCVHIVEWTRPLIEKKCVLFYRIGLISIWLMTTAIDNLSITVHAFACHILMIDSVDEILLPRYRK